MEIEQKLNVTPSQFFELIIDSITVETLKFANKKPFKGLKYKKEAITKLKTPVEVEVEIIELIKDKEYTYIVQGANYYTKGSYQIVEQKDGCLVKYYETFFSDNQRLQLNQKIMTTVTSFSIKRKMTKKLKAMENYILSKQTSV